MRGTFLVLAFLLDRSRRRASSPAAQAAGLGPVIFVETSKGAFSFETFPNEAPTTVAHIVSLVKSGFYDGQRVHRALPGFIVQFGDPQSKDLSKRDLWGKGAAAASGHPVGVAEITRQAQPRDRRRRDSAHMGDPAKADSQILSHARAEAGSRRAIHGVRPRRDRRRCAGEAPGGRHDRQDVRKGIAAGSPSCCLIIAAFATDFAEK